MIREGTQHDCGLSYEIVKAVGVSEKNMGNILHDEFNINLSRLVQSGSRIC